VKGWQRFALPMAALVVLFVMLFFAFIELRRENSAVCGGAKLVHGSGGIVLSRAA